MPVIFGFWFFVFFLWLFFVMAEICCGVVSDGDTTST